MQISYLGHSELLVSIRNDEQKQVNILCDSWLSNYSIGDLSARNPVFKLDYSKIPNIDAIFISHSHADHFDPYTLLELEKNLYKTPIILLPETITYLRPLLEKYVPKMQVQILRNKQDFVLNGINIRGLVFENDFMTNEDDVMTISISNSKEVVYYEVDTVPPDNENTLQDLYDIFTKQKYLTRLYISTRNELEGNLKLLDFTTIKDREKFAQEYKKTRKQEIKWDCERFEEEYDEHLDFSRLPGFCKMLVGQGIVYPPKFDSEIQAIRILPLDEEANLERDILRTYKKKFDIVGAKAGNTYSVAGAHIEDLGDIAYLSDFVLHDPKPNIQLNKFRTYKEAPLNNIIRDTKSQEELILKLLNTRFLPYRIANLDDPMKLILLASANGKYTIKIKYGTSEKYTQSYYSFSFAQFGFELDTNETNYNEDYWANDIDDFFAGEQELYSNFLHKLDKTKTYRFWVSLGANFLNHDLVYKKFEKHFELAKQGRTSDEFVEKFYM